MVLEGNSHCQQLENQETPLRPEGTDSITPASMATLLQMSLQAAIPAGNLSFTQVTSHLPLPKTPQMVGIPFVTWPQASSKGEPAGLSGELLHLEDKMNVTLEQLLKNRATMDFYHKELDLNAKPMLYLNDAQATETRKEAKVHCAATACALQQTHRDSVLALECEVKAEEGQDCQAFIETFGVAYEPICLKPRALLYPLQLLTGNVPLATILGMSVTGQLQAVADRELAPAASIPSILEMPSPQVGTKCWCHSSDQGMPTLRQDEEGMADIDDMPEEHPCQKQNEGRLELKALKEPCREAFT